MDSVETVVPPRAQRRASLVGSSEDALFRTSSRSVASSARHGEHALDDALFRTSSRSLAGEEGLRSRRRSVIALASPDASDHAHATPGSAKYFAEPRSGASIGHFISVVTLEGSECSDSWKDSNSEQSFRQTAHRTQKSRKWLWALVPACTILTIFCLHWQTPLMTRDRGGECTARDLEMLELSDGSVSQATLVITAPKFALEASTSMGVGLSVFSHFATTRTRLGGPVSLVTSCHISALEHIAEVAMLWTGPISCSVELERSEEQLRTLAQHVRAVQLDSTSLHAVMRSEFFKEHSIPASTLINAAIKAAPSDFVYVLDSARLPAAPLYAQILVVLQSPAAEQLALQRLAFATTSDAANPAPSSSATSLLVARRAGTLPLAGPLALADGGSFVAAWAQLLELKGYLILPLATATSNHAPQPSLPPAPAWRGRGVGEEGPGSSAGGGATALKVSLLGAAAAGGGWCACGGAVCGSEGAGGRGQGGSGLAARCREHSEALPRALPGGAVAVEGEGEGEGEGELLAFPFFLRPHGAPSAGEVTAVTQIGLSKLGRLLLLARRWEGPISCAVVVPAEGAALQALSAFVAAHARDLRRTALHLLLGPPAPHPVNVLRNLATDAVQTHLLLQTDVDLLPSPGLHALLQQRAGARGGALRCALCHRKTAVVIPAFMQGPFPGDDAAAVAALPRSKPELLEQLRAGGIVPFNGGDAKPYHGPTNFSRWLAAPPGSAPYPAAWVFRFEPYVVVERGFRQQLPGFEAGFKGYGKNKIAWLEELRFSGFSFAVLPDAFLVHLFHPGREKRRIAPEVHSLYRRFHRRVALQYALPRPSAGRAGTARALAELAQRFPFAAEAPRLAPNASAFVDRLLATANPILRADALAGAELCAARVRELAEEQERVVVLEVGVQLGATAAFWLNLAPSVHVIGVDEFKWPKATNPLVVDNPGEFSPAEQRLWGSVGFNRAAAEKNVLRRAEDPQSVAPRVVWLDGDGGWPAAALPLLEGDGPAIDMVYIPARMLGGEGAGEVLAGLVERVLLSDPRAAVCGGGGGKAGPAALATAEEAIAIARRHGKQLAVSEGGAWMLADREGEDPETGGPLPAGGVAR